MSEPTVGLAELHTLSDAACHDGLRGLADDLDRRLWRPASDAVAAARAAHGQAVERAGLTEACPGDPAAARERARDYLVAVAEQVHGPFLGALRATAPVDTVVDIFRAVRHDTADACRALPDTVEVARERGHLAPRPHDGVGRRAGRLVATAFSAVGLGGPSRTVAARRVATRHHAVRLQKGGDRWREEALRQWCGWLATVETAWATWASPLLTSLAWDEGDEDGPPTALWQLLVSAAEALDESFESLADECPHAGVGGGIQADIDRWTSMLESDLSVAGTFLLRPGNDKQVRSPGLDAEVWKRWQDEALARLEMHGALLSIYVSGHRTLAELEGRLRGEALDLWRQRVREGAESLRASASAAGEGSGMSQAVLDRLRPQAEKTLSDVRTDCPTASALEALARRSAGLTVGAVQAALRGVPSTVAIHRLPPMSRPLRRRTETGHTLALQDMARQSFDALRMERIRTAPSALTSSVEAMTAALAEVAEIVSFGFDAGANELAGDAEEGRNRARELVAEGLERAAAALEEVPRPLAEATRAAVAAARDEVMGGCEALASRALAHRVQGQLIDARTRLVGSVEDLQRRAGPGVQRELQRLRFGWLRVRRLASRLLRRGKSLVGAEGGSVSSALRTARVLAQAEEMVESLPLVYQHLFTSEPVTDPALLAGRQTELAEVEARWHRWQEGKGIPLLVTGRRGFGVSSFFNILVGRVTQDDAIVVHHTLEDRICEEEALARYLARLFQYDAVGSLDELAARILAAEAGEVPDLVALEGLEHVYVRARGGTDLLERLFTLMAETEPRVFWAVSLTASAWQIVEKAEPAAAVQLDQLHLDPLSVAELKEAVLQRHRRSGMHLRFEEPAEGRRLLRRRLRGLRGTDRHQELLQADYFERLHRSAQGNLRLAYFQWLRSVDFTESKGSLVVHPLAALDWSFLDSLDLTQNFTLKAFLEHQTLTLEEHDEIFRCTRQESYHILDSLLNRQLIQMVPEDEGEDVRRSRVLEDIRYRIRPLLTGAVASHLASRNIVH